MATSFQLRLSQMQALINDVDPPVNQPVFGGTHAEMSLVKEGYLRFTSAAKTNVKATLNGTKWIKKYAALGYLSVPDPVGGTPDPCPPCPPCPPEGIVQKASRK